MFMGIQNVPFDNPYYATVALMVGKFKVVSFNCYFFESILLRERDMTDIYKTFPSTAEEHIFFSGIWASWSLFEYPIAWLGEIFMYNIVPGNQRITFGGMQMEYEEMKGEKWALWCPGTWLCIHTTHTLISFPFDKGISFHPH